MRDTEKHRMKAFVRASQRGFVMRAIHEIHRLCRACDEISIGVFDRALDEAHLENFTELDDFQHFRCGWRASDNGTLVWKVR